MNNNASCNLLAFYVQHKLLTAIHKHYSVEEWLVFGKDHPDVLPVSLSFFFFVTQFFSVIPCPYFIFLFFLTSDQSSSHNTTLSSYMYTFIPVSSILLIFSMSLLVVG